jgi:hypothetical protein
MVTATVDTLGWSAAWGLIIMCWQATVCAELLMLANSLVMAEFLTSKASQWPWYVLCHCDLLTTYFDFIRQIDT